MNRTADLAAERVIDHAVLLDPRNALKSGRDDGRLEVVSAARRVEHFGPGAVDRRLDLLADLLCRRHRSHSSRLRAQLGPIINGVITISELGAEKVREFLEAQNADLSVAGLRVGVRGGGCSGFQYQLAFDQQRDGDLVFESRGLKLLVDRDSLEYVEGSTIDYQEGLQGAGFKVENPNVVAACGCGSSFRVAEREQVSAL